MRWWRRKGKHAQNLRSELRSWRVGMVTRERGWRGLKARWRGLRGSEVCWRRESEIILLGGTPNNANHILEHKETLFRRGVKRYLRILHKGRFCKRGGTPVPHHSAYITTGTTIEVSTEHYTLHTPATTLRYPTPTLTFIDLPTLILEIPDFDFEPWLMELWNDFLNEPTPYLVASAMLYLGGLLLVSHYHGTIWWVIRLWFYLLPWDDEWPLGYW